VTPAQLEALRKFREQNDPLTHYVPNPMQEEFHRSNARHKLVTGGNRSGKTGSICADIAMKVRGIHPHHPWVGPLRIWFWVPSRGQGAAVVGRKLFRKSELKGPCADKPLIPAHEIEDLRPLKVGGIEVFQRCLLKNGSEILMGWSGVEKSWARFEGLQLHGVVFDENAAEGDILNESLLRVSDERDRWKDKAPWLGFVYWGATGTKVNDNFERFKRSCQQNTNGDWGYFPIPSSERAGFSAETEAGIASYLTEQERRIRLLGESTAGDELLIFGRQWDDNRHMRKTDYVIQPDDQLWMSIDPGMSHPTGIGFFVLNKENPLKIRFVKYIELVKTSAGEDARVIAEWLRGRTLEGVIHDPAANKPEKVGLSVRNQWIEALMRQNVRVVRGWIPGRNRHEPGIARVMHYLDPEPGNPFAETLLEFNSSDESGCQLMRYQMMKYRSHEPNRVTGPRGVVKVQDEACDVIRYACSITPAWAPGIGCGLPTEQNFQEIGPMPDSDELRYRAHLAASRDMVRNLQSRDTGPGAINLW
jgi:hypothetical protein